MHSCVDDRKLMQLLLLFFCSWCQPLRWSLDIQKSCGKPKAWWRLNDTIGPMPFCPFCIDFESFVFICQISVVWGSDTFNGIDSRSPWYWKASISMETVDTSWHGATIMTSLVSSTSNDTKTEEGFEMMGWWDWMKTILSKDIRRTQNSPGWTGGSCSEKTPWCLRQRGGRMEWNGSWKKMCGSREQ